MRIRPYVALATLLTLVLVGSTASKADEGMWTFDNPPLKQLQERYGFTPAQQWLDHVRLSSIRFNDGGSGSFVSPNGLVITNQHGPVSIYRNTLRLPDLVDQLLRKAGR